MSEHAHRGPRERLELWSALLLAAATVATAYSAYEASRWSGQQSIDFTSAGATRTESGKARSDADALLTIDANLFGQWAQAYAKHDKTGEKVAEHFFRDEFRPAFKEWVASKPLKNPDAAENPFQLPSYKPERLTESNQLADEATAKFDDGRDANQTSDNYVLATIFFAAVLFFAGIATKFRSDRLVMAALAFGTIVFLGGLGRLVTLPFL